MTIKEGRITSNRVIEYSHTIGICVMTGRGFMFPVDTAISKDGKIHTVSKGYRPAVYQTRTNIYDVDGQFYLDYGSFGNGPGQYQMPCGMDADSAGNVYVSDEEINRITVYSNDGKYQTHWGKTGSGPGEFVGPSGLAIDKNDDVYVADHLNNRIQKYTKDGKFLFSFGDSGSQSENLNLPWGLTVTNDGFIYVADWGNHGVVKFSGDGEFVARYGSEGSNDGEFVNPSSVAVDEDGFIYVADWGNERVQILDQSGNFVTKLRGESDLSKWAEEAYVSNQEEYKTRQTANLEPELSQFGGDAYDESAHTEKFFWGPTSVKLDSQGRLYVTESNRHRVQIYKRVS